MEIKIFVVKTEFDKLHDKILNYGLDNTKTATDIMALVKEKQKLKENLEHQKRELIRLFGGLTITQSQIGYWQNEQGFFIVDNVETWQIFVNKSQTEKLEYETVLRQDVEIDLKYILTQIKHITQQQTQAYTIDNEIFFL